MKVLMSIKPEFAQKILSGEKKFEFRRVIFKNQNIKKVLIYASSPIQKVVGQFEIDEIIYEDVSTLWDNTREHAGVSRARFMKYFAGKTHGFAIKIKNVRKFKTPKCIQEAYNVHPPQSFLYVRSTMSNK